MQSFRIIALLLLLPFMLSAQNDEAAIKTAVQVFFEGLNKGDSTLVLAACMETPVFQTCKTDTAGHTTIRTENFKEFVAWVGSPRTDVYEERIEFGHIRAEAALAVVWTPYTFWLNGKLSHCGTNSFQLVKTDGAWKIQYIIDTRRKKGCE